jgi:hypothetical protein
MVVCSDFGCVMAEAPRLGKLLGDGESRIRLSRSKGSHGRQDAQERLSGGIKAAE